MLIQSSVAIKW